MQFFSIFEAHNSCCKNTHFVKIEPSKYTHIVWDWNGTLLNDNWLCVEVMNTMLAPRHLPLLTLEHYREILRLPGEGLLSDAWIRFQ